MHGVARGQRMKALARGLDPLEVSARFREQPFWLQAMAGIDDHGRRAFGLLKQFDDTSAVEIVVVIIDVGKDARKVLAVSADAFRKPVAQRGSAIIKRAFVLGFVVLGEK